MEKEIIIKYQQYANIEDLALEEKDLLREAINAYSLAYAPYSNFKVGAAALLDNGNIIKGCNLENASYSVTNCAERTLLANHLINYPKNKIIVLAISYCGGSNNHLPLSPCGVCRQALKEYESNIKQPIKLIMGSKNGKILVVPSISSILPFGFDATYL